MFGFAKKLVNSIESQLTSDTSQGNAQIDESRQGLRILSVKQESIGYSHGLESWFDFIVGLNGTDINAYLERNTSSGYVGYDNLFNYIKHEVEVAENDITFTVFSSKGSVVRDITISPEEIKLAEKQAATQLQEVSLSTEANPSGSSADLQWTPKLGVSFQLTPLSTGFFTWHILRVLPGSPAYTAGLMPDEYIIQSQDGLLATGGEDLLSKVLQSQYAKNGDGCEVVLYVYNYDSDCVRPVRVILKAGHLWGGKGILGCDIGYGLLHRIPEVMGKFTNAQSATKTLSQSESSQAGFATIATEAPITQPPEFLPLQVKAPSFAHEDSGETIDEAAKSVVSNPHRKRTHQPGHRSANVNLDAYFNEQTKISQSADSGSAAKSEGSVPPPPPKKM